ncbi:protein FAM83H-like [Betta splendens]|uniref:Protein FAM83H-like n=1 Tax=Betta splendens TaxID=158456 RepID=A0A6P7N948_BETSP|nr:protein FAM83H-like [Betta splendens]
MESNLSCLSSLKGETEQIYIQPHYKESYRLAIYALLCGGREAYDAFLRAESISHFLSEEEVAFILENARSPDVEDESEQRRAAGCDAPPSTYLPMESDEEVPGLELGWPGVSGSHTDTSISLLFHPPRPNTPTIKEVVRKHIQHAEQLIAVTMDVFTDVDIFKEVVSATLRGVVVYILLDYSHFRSFYNMSQRVGVNIQDLKNMRVRTVEGLQYQCQSGLKFHGGLEQKFLLVDCSTVLYGSYSYTWAYEKLNVSMVLVVTGQLLWSYDEEFRRLYARSTEPAVLSRERPSVQHRNAVGMQRTSSSRLSLHQFHTQPSAMHGMRTAQDNAATMSRGLSVQEKLHQSHSPDMGSLLRGYSYGADLQNTNSMTRLKMGTKDIGRSVSKMRGDGDLLATKRLPQQIRHLKRYGADQNMIPFNSEMSLHRWKIDSYLNGSDMPVDASYDRISPMTSPHNSHTGLNEYPSQVIHSRSREIKSRMEERRQKRLSLQEFVHLRRSQESLRSMYSTVERPVHMSSLRSLDMRQGVAEFEPNAHSHLNNDAATHQGPRRESNRREPAATHGHNPAFQYDANVAQDRNAREMCAWHDPPPDLDTGLDDPSLQSSYLQSSSLSLQHPRTMESLTEVPEEKESSNSHAKSLDSSADNVKSEKIHQHYQPVLHPCHKEQTKGPSVDGTKSSGSAAPRERKKSASSDTSQPAVQTKSSHPETQQEEPKIQRKNSMKKKVQSMFSSDEKKASKKEERSLQRKASIKSQSPSGSNQNQDSVNGLHNHSTEAEKQKSTFSRLGSYRSSKKKATLAAEQEHSSRSSPDGGLMVSQAAIDKAYSRYEFLLGSDRSSSLKRSDSGYQNQSGTDKKLGRFMQRMGNLMSKNKQS